MQQHGKGKGKASESLVCNQCMECGLECKLGPGKLTSCIECCKVKAKCKWLSEEKLERKCKQVQIEPSGLKKLKKMLEESDMMAELVEVLRGV